MDSIEYIPGDEYTKTTLHNLHRYYSIKEYNSKYSGRYMYVWIDGLSIETTSCFAVSKNYLIYIDYVDKCFIIRPIL